MIPTSIDGTDITGATIDGTDVQEITVDGQTVFSAVPSNLPVAYSNLVAWYPFDSATYGGSNADDVTAILGGSGDDTAYDGTVDGATYQSSGGVTDINAGANSGAFDFDGSNDRIDFGSIPSIENISEMTIMAWVNLDSYPSISWVNIFGSYESYDDNMFLIVDTGGELYGRVERNTVGDYLDGNVVPLNTWQHLALTFQSGNTKIYNNAVETDSGTTGPSTTPSVDINWYAGFSNRAGEYANGSIEDCRIYNKSLSQNEVQQIVQNTQP